MDINRIFSFADETALEAYNTLNGVDLALENRIGFAESEESYWIMKGTDGTVEITGEDFNNYTEVTYGIVNAQIVNLDTFRNDISKAFYFDANPYKDTIGDWKIYVDTDLKTSVCTVGNETKGGGTWVVRQTITVLP